MVHDGEADRERSRQREQVIGRPRPPNEESWLVPGCSCEPEAEVPLSAEEQFYST